MCLQQGKDELHLPSFPHWQPAASLVTASKQLNWLWFYHGIACMNSACKYVWVWEILCVRVCVDSVCVCVCIDSVYVDSVCVCVCVRVHHCVHKCVCVCVQEWSVERREKHIHTQKKMIRKCPLKNLAKCTGTSVPELRSCVKVKVAVLGACP